MTYKEETYTGESSNSMLFEYTHSKKEQIVDSQISSNKQEKRRKTKKNNRENASKNVAVAESTYEQISNTLLQISKRLQKLESQHHKTDTRNVPNRS